jgi:hypothetical protein
LPPKGDEGAANAPDAITPPGEVIKFHHHCKELFDMRDHEFPRLINALEQKSEPTAGEQIMSMTENESPEYALPASEYAPPKYRQQVPNDDLVLMQKEDNLVLVQKKDDMVLMQKDDDFVLLQKKMDTQALYIEALTQRIEDQALAIKDLEKVIDVYRKTLSRSHTRVREGSGWLRAQVR